MEMLKSSWLIVGLAAFGMPFLTGFLGLLPIDQSIVFEAGGRISRGEVPFTDFFIPYGLIPSLMQSVFFKLFGISWFSYVLHAAFINSLFAIILFDILRMWLPAQKRGKLIAATLLAAWSFYPMMGTPFMDNHSFFFGFLAYWSIVTGIIRRNRILLLLSFSLLVIGFYSKPLPVIFWIFPVLLECWIYRASTDIYLKWLVCGVFIALIIAILPFFFFDGNHFYYYTYFLPFRIGQSRMTTGDSHNLFLILVSNERYKIWIGMLIIVLAYFIFKVRNQEKWLQLSFYRSSCILLVSIIGAAFTKNTFYHLLVTAVIIAFTVLTCFDFQKIYSRSMAKVYRTFFTVGWIFFLSVITWVNFSRRVNEIVFRVSDLKNFSPELGIYLKTIGNDYTTEDLHELYLLMKNESCLYVGDMMFLYSLTGGRNPWPVIHLHDGTSYDSKDVARFEEVKGLLVNNLVKYRTSVVIEDILFYGHEPLVQFSDQLKGRMKKKIGNLRIYEIDQEKVAWMVRNLKSSLAK